MSHILQKNFNENIKITKLGEWDPNLLTKTLELSFSDQGADTPQGQWQAQAVTVEGLCEQFQNFEIGSKDGRAILQGVVKDGRRSKSSMLHADILMLDFDSGYDQQNVISQIRELGLAAIVYTTYSNGITELNVSKNAMQTALGKDAECNLDQVRSYLIDKKHWCRDLAETVKIERDGGGELTLAHAPMPKYRVVFFLKDRFDFVGMSCVGLDPHKEWKSRYIAFAETFGIPFDKSCSDASRLMYTPRCAEETTSHEFIEIGGKALDLNAIKISRSVQNGRSKKSTNTITTPGLKRFLEVNGDRFEARDWIANIDPSMIRREKDDGSAEIECPYDEDHSNPGDHSDQACWVINAADSESGHYQIKCLHNSCIERSSVEFVDALCQRYECSCDDLKSYLSEVSIGPNGETEADVWELIEKFSNKSSSDEIYNICYLIAGFSHRTDQEKAIKRLKELTGLSLKILRNELKIAANSRADDARSQSSIDDMSVIRNSMNFEDQVSTALKALENGNDYDPILFRQSGGRRVRIFHDNSRLEVSMLDTKGLTAEVSQLVLFSTMSSGSVKNVAPFKDVISHIEGIAPPPFPFLKGVVYAPIFSANGSLRTEQGYDPDTKFYIDFPYEINKISSSPPSDEVEDAKTLLLEAIEGFPFSDKFDGSETLPAREANAPNMLRGRSSRAGALAMILTPFMREMINGPTPGFCIDKPKAGTGAGYLVDTAQTILTGRRADATPVSENKDELRKVITAALLQNSNCLFMDNINHHIDDAALAAAITGGFWRDRILGSSEMTDLEIKLQWIFAANNGSYSHELMRRFVPIRIDAGVSDPTSRQEFKHPDLHRWLNQKRPELVRACLTLIQNWVAKDCSPGNAKLASFEDWASSASGVLECAGVPGLLDNHPAYMASRNQEVDAALALVTEWFDKYSSDPVTSTDLCNLLPEDLDLPGNQPDPVQRSRQVSRYIRKSVEGNTFDVEPTQKVGAISSIKKFTIRCVADGLRNGSKTWRLDIVE